MSKTLLRPSAIAWLHRSNNTVDVDTKIHTLPTNAAGMLKLVEILLNQNERIVQEKADGNELWVDDSVPLTQSQAAQLANAAQKAANGIPQKAPPLTPPQSPLPLTKPGGDAIAASLYFGKKGQKDGSILIFQTSCIASLFDSSDPLLTVDNLAAYLQYLLGRAVQCLGGYFDAKDDATTGCGGALCTTITADIDIKGDHNLQASIKDLVDKRTMMCYIIVTSQSCI